MTAATPWPRPQRAFIRRSPFHRDAATSAPYLRSRRSRAARKSSGQLSRGTVLKLSTKTRATTLSVALAGTLALSACGASNETADAGGNGDSTAEQLSGDLNGAGSSAQQAAMQAWQAGFSSIQSGVTVNYDPVGSGGGREQFLS